MAVGYENVRVCDLHGFRDLESREKCEKIKLSCSRCRDTLYLIICEFLFDTSITNIEMKFICDINETTREIFNFKVIGISSNLITLNFQFMKF